MELFRVNSFRVTKGFSGFSVVALLVLASVSVFADEASEVETILELMGVPDQVDSSAKEVLNLYLVKVKEDEASQQVKNLVNQYRAEVRQLVDKTISWDAVREQYIQSYANHLSSEDVKAIREFIESSAGKNFIVGQKLANSEIQLITKKRIQAELTEPISKLSHKLRTDLSAIKQDSKG